MMLSILRVDLAIELAAVSGQDLLEPDQVDVPRVGDVAGLDQSGKEEGGGEAEQNVHDDGDGEWNLEHVEQKDQECENAQPKADAEQVLGEPRGVVLG